MPSEARCILKHWDSLCQDPCNRRYLIFLENLLGSFTADTVGIVLGFESAVPESCVVHRGLLSSSGEITDLLFLVACRLN